MGVVVEALKEALAHVLVDEGVVRDLVDPLVELGLVRQLAVQQQVGDFEVGRLLGELFDRIAAIAEDAFVAVDEVIDDLAFGGRTKGGIVEPDPW